MCKETGQTAAGNAQGKIPLVCYSSDVDFLPVDADPLKGEPPQGVNFVLKHNVPGWMVHKIWVSNMSHCITALYGQFKGKTYIGESGQDPDIMRCAILAKSEANFAVCHACGFTQEQIEQEEPQSREEYFADSATITIRIPACVSRRI